MDSVGGDEERSVWELTCTLRILGVITRNMESQLDEKLMRSLIKVTDE